MENDLKSIRQIVEDELAEDGLPSTRQINKGCSACEWYKSRGHGIKNYRMHEVCAPDKAKDSKERNHLTGRVRKKWLVCAEENQNLTCKFFEEAQNFKCPVELAVVVLVAFAFIVYRLLGI